MLHLCEQLFIACGIQRNFDSLRAVFDQVADATYRKVVDGNNRNCYYVRPVEVSNLAGNLICYEHFQIGGAHGDRCTVS